MTTRTNKPAAINATSRRLSAALTDLKYHTGDRRRYARWKAARIAEWVAAGATLNEAGEPVGVEGATKSWRPWHQLRRWKGSKILSRRVNKSRRRHGDALCEEGFWDYLREEGECLSYEEQEERYQAEMDAYWAARWEEEAEEWERQRAWDLFHAAAHNHARLSGADLRGANFNGGGFLEADLSGANLHRASLGYANLRYADLGGADLSGADLTGADLTGACLRGANLSGANLTGANLTGADLTGALLLGADFTGATVLEREARYQGVGWMRKPVTASLRELGADLTDGCIMPDGSLHYGEGVIPLAS